MFFNARTPLNFATDEDTWEVDKILRHRITGGRYEFLAKWKGHTATTWEPFENFVENVNTEILKYARDRKLILDITKELPVLEEPVAGPSSKAKGPRNCLTCTSKPLLKNHPGKGCVMEVRKIFGLENQTLGMDAMVMC